MGINKITNKNMVFAISSSPFGGASSSLVAATSSLAMVVSYLVVRAIWIRVPQIALCMHV
jgi:hypothetical protein